jgi:Tol biopolymer transport system component
MIILESSCTFSKGRFAMRLTTKTIVWLVAFWGISSIQAVAKPFAVGPYFGQTPPGSTAQVFAPGLICDTQPHQWESHGQFSADGNTFCFNRLRYVYITENTDQGWAVPKRIKSVPEIPWSPYLSLDANSIYFMYSHDLYRCNRTARGWAKPQKLGPPLSSSAAEWGFSLAADNSFYLASTRKGGRGGDVWYVPFVDNTWSQAINISAINTRYSDGAPGVAPDESFLVFNSVRPRGLGGADLYLSLRQSDGTWTTPRNLGPRVNSAYLDICPYISPDKKYLFFTRSNGFDPRKYSADIYWVALNEYLPESYR